MAHKLWKVSTSPIVAVICGNLNMPAHTTRAHQASTMLFVLIPILPGTAFGATPCVVNGQVLMQLIRFAGEND